MNSAQLAGEVGESSWLLLYSLVSFGFPVAKLLEGIITLIKTELHRVVNSQTQKKYTFGFELIDCKCRLLWVLLNPSPVVRKTLFCFSIAGISCVTF